MAEAETALQMGARHVAEQEARVSEQEQLIARLRREGQATDHAEGVLAEMCNMLVAIRDHLERLQPRREG